MSMLKTVDGYPIRKQQYGEKLIDLLEKSQKILVLGVDHIGSAKLSELKKRFRNRARFLFGKNTLIRRIIRRYVRQTGHIEVANLVNALRGNCCLVFLANDPSIYEMMRIQNEIVAASRITCTPRAGDVAPCDVWIKPMDTGLEPTRTSFFAAMNIATKINRGQIQIINRVCVVRAGNRVNASQAALLHALGLKPFSYAIDPIALYDHGECYPANIMSECDPARLSQVFMAGIENVSALSFGVGYPNLLTVPHSVTSAYNLMLSFGVGCLDEYSWDGLDQVKRHLSLKPDDEHDDDGFVISRSPPSSPAPSPSPSVNIFLFDPEESDSSSDESDDDD